MKKKNTRQMFERIKGITGLPDEWGLEFDFEMDSCDHELKIISLRESSVLNDPPYYVMQRMIHEVAHALNPGLPRSSWLGHGPEFFKTMGKVLIECSHLIDEFHPEK